MVDKVNLLPISVGRAGDSWRPAASPAAASDGRRFEEVLKTELGRPGEVRFSAHAQRRLEARHIDFDDQAAVRLGQAIDKAASKGSRESLILMDDLALVVSVRNRLVITAVDAESRKDNVFTNIDSVVLT